MCLPDFSATKIVTWKCHVNESTNDKYDMILGRYLLTALGLEIIFSENFMIGGEVPYKGWSVPMVDVTNYSFWFITDKTVKQEKSFVNAYVDKRFESENAISSKLRMRRILDVKHKKADLNEFMTKQCQKHLTTTERNIRLQLLKTF